MSCTTDPESPRTPHRLARLTVEQVQEIIRRREAGETFRGLAADFGCSSANINSICKGQTWKAITGVKPYLRRPRRMGVEHPLARLTDDQVRMIVRRRQTGIPYRMLADEYGVSLMTICSICLGRTWTHVTGLPCREPKFTKKRKEEFDEFDNAL